MSDTLACSHDDLKVSPLKRILQAAGLTLIALMIATAETSNAGNITFFILLFYFLPVVLACGNGKANSGAIFILNLFLGWTFVGWVVALVWAEMKD